MKDGPLFTNCPHCKKLLWNAFSLKDGRKVVCPFCKKRFHYNGFSLLHSLWQLIVRNELPYTLSKGSFSVISHKPEPEEDLYDYNEEDLFTHLHGGMNYFDSQYAVADAEAGHKQYLRECATQYQCAKNVWLKEVASWNKQHPDDSIDPDAQIYLR